MRSTPTVLLALALSVLSGACSTPGHQYYAPDRVRIQDVVLDYNGLLTIDFVTDAETLWYCPGVDVHWEQGDLFVSFVRAKFDEPGAPDVLAELVPPATYRVTVDTPATRTVHVTDSVRDRVVWKDGVSQLGG